MSADLRQLTDELLAAARRAVAVALVVDVASEEVHAIRTMLPDQAEMVRVLDVLGWPGSPETPVVLSPDDQDTLSTIISATLILALQETERSAYQALRSAYGTGIDPGPVYALESLAGLALWINADSRTTHGRVDRAGTQAHGSGRSTSVSAFASSVTLPTWATDAQFHIEWVNPALQELLGTPLEDITNSPWQQFCDPEDLARLEGAVIPAVLEQRNFTLEVGVGPAGGPYSRLLMVCAPRIEGAGELTGWTGVCFDISNDDSRDGIRRLLQPLTISSARTALLLEEFPGQIWTTDRDLIVTSTMGTWFQRGTEPTGGVGTPLMEIFGDDGSDHPVRRAYEQALAGAPAQYYVDWQGRTLDVRVRPLSSAAGTVIGTVAMGTDISDIVASSQRNTMLREQLELAQRVGGIGSWDVDLRNGTAEWSDNAYRLVGVEPGAVPATLESLLSFVDRDTVDVVRTAFRRVRESGTPEETIFRITRADGEVRTIRAAAHAETDGHGTPVRLYGVLQDITDLIERDRLATRLSRQLSQAEDIARVGTWEMDGTDGQITWSDEMFEILGYTPGIAVPTLELLLSSVHPDDLSRINAAFATVRATFLSSPRSGEILVEALRIVTHDGRTRWVRLVGAAEVGVDGSLIRVAGTLHDVTELREATRDSARLAGELDLSQGAAHVGSWALDPRTGALAWSQENFRIMGIEPGSVHPTVDLLLGMIHPDDRDRVATAFETGVQAREPFEITHRIVRPDGDVRTIYMTAHFSDPDAWSGEQVFGTARDITDLVEAQDSVARLDARFAFAREVAGVGTFEFNTKTLSGNWSQTGMRILGLGDAAGNVPGDQFMALIHPDDVDAMGEQTRRGLASGGEYQQTFRITRPDGGIRHIRLWVNVEGGAQGRTATSAYGAVQDVTAVVAEARRADRMGAQLVSAGEITGVAWWELDPLTGHAVGSDGVLAIHGLTPGDSRATFAHTQAMIHPDDRERVKRFREAMLRTGESGTHTYRIIRADRDIRTIRSSSSVELSPTGTAQRIVGVMRDITDDIVADERLKRTVRDLSLAQELAYLGRWEHDRTSGVGEWSEEMYRILGVAQGSVPATLATFLSYVHPEDRAGIIDSFDGANKSEEPCPRTFRMVRADGTARIVRTVTQMHTDDDGRMIRALGVVQDITDVAEAERRADLLGAKLTAAETTGSIGTWDLETGTGTATWSDEMFRLLGLVPGSTPPSCELYNGFVHPEDLESWRSTHNAAVQDARPGTSTHRIVRADGQIRTIRSAIGVDADLDGTGTRLFGTHADITAPSGAADESARLMRQLEMAHRLTNTGGWEIDLATGTPTWSEGMFDVVGVPRGAPPADLAAFVAECVHPHDHDRVRKTFDEHTHSGIGFVAAFRVCQSDGGWAPVDLVAEFDHDALGYPTRMRCIVHRTSS